MCSTTHLEMRGHGHGARIPRPSGTRRRHERTLPSNWSCRGGGFRDAARTDWPGSGSMASCYSAFIDRFRSPHRPAGWRPDAVLVTLSRRRRLLACRGGLVASIFSGTRPGNTLVCSISVVARQRNSVRLISYSIMKSPTSRAPPTLPCRIRLLTLIVAAMAETCDHLHNWAGRLVGGCVGLS